MKHPLRNLLIVDDDDNDIFLLQRALRKVDPHLVIRTASDGVQAIAYLDGEGEFHDRARFPFPAFLFVDLKMPRLDGFAVLEHLKDHAQWAVIPRVVFTTSNDSDDIKKAFATGASAYHVKPMTFREREDLCRVMLDYWGRCEVPETNECGTQVETVSTGKLGERIPQP